MFLIAALGDVAYTPIACVSDLEEALDCAAGVAENIWLARFAAILQDDRFDPLAYRVVRIIEFSDVSHPRVFQTIPVRPSVGEAIGQSQRDDQSRLATVEG